MSCRISAVVCTYNRSDRMAAAVRSLLVQTLPSTDYEVLVVDNCSTDDTAAVVDRLRQGAPNLRYEHEPTLGLNPARNRGWQAARAPHVAYLDDDAIADPGWLAAILEVFETVRPTPAAVGGKIEP